MPTETAVLRRRLKLAGGLAAVLAVAVVIWGVFARAHDAGAMQTWSNERATPAVRTVAPKASGAPDVLELPGQLQAYNDAPIYARSQRLCHIFEQASARQDGSQQDGAMRRYSLVLSLSFCFPFEYVKILRFKSNLPATSFPRTTHRDRKSVV